MDSYAIEVENLCKIYKLYDKPMDRLKESLIPLNKKRHKEFYALNSINFKVRQGETIGIIGKNGSGKSTLLKIITGIVSPTNGSVKVKGKISALLELGAGFNPELTGVENIYLNGSLMGYDKKDIDEKLNDILDFADIGDFVYQPVKTYSSGMFVRLAFALAINVDPDILIVDEALSVGDVRFQQKCYRKINEFKQKGTVLFVSHDTGAVTNFCERVVWLNEGEVLKEGTPDDILEDYHAFMNYGELASSSAEEIESTQIRERNSGEQKDLLPIPSEAKNFGKKGAVITGASIINHMGFANNVITSGEMAELIVRVEANEDILIPILGFIIKDRLGNSLLIVNTEFENIKLGELTQGQQKLFKWNFRFPKIKDGQYSIDIALAEGTFHNHDQHHWINDAIIVDVKSNKKYASAQGMLIPENVKLIEC
ncbi:ABC transporter ATP-binding protein [Paenibacillus alvei]|uniref:ABC transporter ATP-binding protein n=1 Tax=Paenibacillus alvei TaxID=44250 RepID=UPI0013DABB82|nr:ABC transporter ATP-binding protein [Paenibacillus alvei]NEZ43389.1 ATP-binding cassette domain-containing protein [Paenibacillus alvei]